MEDKDPDLGPERDDYLDEDLEELSQRSIFAAGWFRAVLVLVVLAIVLVVSLPYLLDWLEPKRPRLDDGLAPREAAAPPAPTATPAPPPAMLAPASPAAPPRPLAEPPARVKKAPAPTPPEAAKPAAKSAPRREPVQPAARPERARAEARVQRPAPARPAPAASPAPAAGDYWVQVGAFEERRNADRLAETLGRRRLPVEVTEVTRSVASRHEVVVTGAPVEDVRKALGAGGATAEADPGGVVVRPPLELRDAVALSKRLAGEGLAVKIRRVGGGSATATHHVVRVGGFADRERALAVRSELQAGGHSGFITKGPAR